MAVRYRTHPAPCYSLCRSRSRRYYPSHISTLPRTQVPINGSNSPREPGLIKMFFNPWPQERSFVGCTPQTPVLSASRDQVHLLLGCHQFLLVKNRRKQSLGQQQRCTILSPSCPPLILPSPTSAFGAVTAGERGHRYACQFAGRVLDTTAESSGAHRCFRRLPGTVDEKGGVAISIYWVPCPTLRRSRFCTVNTRGWVAFGEKTRFAAIKRGDCCVFKRQRLRRNTWHD